MMFREWLEEARAAWQSDLDSGIDIDVASSFVEALEMVAEEFDRRFEGPHLGLWKGPIKEVGWTEHLDAEVEDPE